MDESEPLSSRPLSSRPAPRGSAAYPRKRAVTACQVCRARRTKCDNRKPSCSFCLKVGAACVQASDDDLSSFDPASLKILERLEGLEQLVRSLGGAGGDDNEPARKKRVVPLTEGHEEAGVRTCPPHDSVDSGFQISMGMVAPPDTKHILSWPCLRELGDDETGRVTDDQRAGATTAAEISAVPSVAVVPPGLFGALEEPRQIKVLLDNFFDYAHVKNPVLDEPTTRQMVLSKAIDGLGFDWSAESCLALLICALGSVSTPFGPSLGAMPGTLAYAHGQGYFQAAQKRLGVVMASETIIAPQCFFLSGVFLMCTFQPVRAWRMFIQAVVGCQQFDFMTEPSERRERDGQDDSLHQAVYWSAWKSERELRGDFRRPDFIASDRDSRLYPRFFPTPPALRQQQQQSATENSGPSREQVSWYFYLAEISLRRLSVRLTAEMAAMGQTQGSGRGLLDVIAAALPSWETQAGEWQASLPPCLSLGLPAEQDDVCRFVLRGHLVNLYETIYWPFLACLLESSESYASDGGNGSEFARLAQRSLENHLFRLVVNKAGYRHRHHGTDPMIQSCSRSALVLLATSRISRARTGRGGDVLPIRLPDGWQGEVGGVVELLEFWSAETGRYDDIRRVLERGLAEDDA